MDIDILVLSYVLFVTSSLQPAIPFLGCCCFFLCVCVCICFLGGFFLGGRGVWLFWGFFVFWFGFVVVVVVLVFSESHCSIIGC